uniref:PR domain containing 9 n=1 Tax=Xiphophorus maculatus TaxID=8083 RepID=A0A3B5R1L6_XIPMA
VCELCSQQGRGQPAGRSVQRQHPRPYCCSHCRRSFSQASGLVRHQSVHFGRAAATDKPCTECSKSFSRLQSLKAHLLLHQGQRLFKFTYVF